MAHSRITKSGNREYFLYVGKDPATGKPERISKTFPNTREGKKQAEIWIAENTIDSYNGVNVKPEQYKVKDYLRRWLSDYQVNLSPTTYDGYKVIIEAHIIPELGGLKLTELTPQHIQTYQSEKLKHGNRETGEGLSNTTVRHHHRLLNKALNQAVMLNLIPYNPCNPVPAPKRKKKEIKTLSPSQINQLLNLAKNKEVYYFIVVAIYTGMRRSEILALRWQDVDMNNGRISVKRALVTKNGKGSVFKDMPKNKSSVRIVEISSTVINALKKLQKIQNKEKITYGEDYDYSNGDLIFCNPDGSNIYPSTPGRQMKRLLAGTDLEGFTPHMLRHTHATLMIDNGVDVKIVSERLGHADTHTTHDIYTHVSSEMQRKAMDIFESITKPS